MPPSPQPSPPPPRFTLAGLFELIAGIGLFLGLVTQFGYVGLFVAGVAGIMLLMASGWGMPAVSAEDRMQFGCLLSFLFAILLGLFAEGSGVPERGQWARPDFWVLNALTVAFVILAIRRRMRRARRMRGEGPKAGSQ